MDRVTPAAAGKAKPKGSGSLGDGTGWRSVQSGWQDCEGQQSRIFAQGAVPADLQGGAAAWRLESADCSVVNLPAAGGLRQRREGVRHHWHFREIEKVPDQAVPFDSGKWKSWRWNGMAQCSVRLARQRGPAVADLRARSSAARLAGWSRGMAFGIRRLQRGQPAGSGRAEAAARRCQTPLALSRNRKKCRIRLSPSTMMGALNGARAGSRAAMRVAPFRGKRGCAGSFHQSRLHGRRSRDRRRRQSALGRQR